MTRKSVLAGLPGFGRAPWSARGGPWLSARPRSVSSRPSRPSAREPALDLASPPTLRVRQTTTSSRLENTSDPTTMLSIATAALSFSAPVSKTFDSKVAAAGAAAALSLVAMPVREPPPPPPSPPCAPRRCAGASDASLPPIPPWECELACAPQRLGPPDNPKAAAAAPLPLLACITDPFCLPAF